MSFKGDFLSLLRVFFKVQRWGLRLRRLCDNLQELCIGQAKVLGKCLFESVPGVVRERKKAYSNLGNDAIPLTQLLILHIDVAR